MNSHLCIEDENKNIMKLCSRCKKYKHLDFFPKGGGAFDRMSFCKECQKKRYKYRLLYKYNLDESQIKEYEEAKSCEICGSEISSTILFPPASRKALVIDHDHKKNKFRGFICHSCNLVLGFSKDDVTILEKCILYLKKHQ